MLFFTRYTLAWKGILVAVFFSVRLQILSATVAPIGVKFCMMVHIGSGQIFSPFGGGTPRGSQIRNFEPKFWPFDREYLENCISRSVTRQLQLNISSTRAF